MKLYLRYTACMFAIFLSMSLFSTVNAEVRCTCPTIKADGKGNSSCSVNESGGRCTIDYNLFGDRETQAADLLNNISGYRFTPYPTLSTRESLDAAASNNELSRQVQLYLLVATVSQQMSFPNSVDNRTFSDVENMINNYDHQIIQAFDPQLVDHFSTSQNLIQSPNDSNLVLVDDTDIVITYGCISIETNGAYMMFKTWWSPSRLLPKCL